MRQGIFLSGIVFLLIFLFAGAGFITAEKAISTEGSPGSKNINQEEIVIGKGVSCISEKCHAEFSKRKYRHRIGSDPEKCDICHIMKIRDRHVFEKIPEVTAPLCRKCHSVKVIVPRQIKKAPPKVMDIGENKVQHKPFKEGRCTVCHDAHGSNYPWHLRADYPWGTYATYKKGRYNLCTIRDCHKGLDEMLGNPRTLKLTMFRNGNANLHWRHVNKQKGRTCNICHDPHATKGPSLVKETFRFGNRLLDIRYTQTAEGGKCETTCHRYGEYNRYKPVKNLLRATPFPGKQATEEELEQSRIEDQRRLEKIRTQKEE